MDSIFLQSDGASTKVSTVQEVEVRVISVFHFRGGRQVERWFYPEDMDAWDSIFDG